MTERGLPSADGSPACPFVAFEDDRDARATSPDHRHRCYADVEPAPRALAHQEAYCLSSAFPVCPTFQEWARREAAHARSVSDAASAAAGSSPGGGSPADGVPRPADEWIAPIAATGASAAAASSDARADPDEPLALPPRRNPRRDWAAPPPWASGPANAGGTGSRYSADDPDDDDLGAGGGSTRRPAEGQGLAGSAADRIAGGGAVRPGSIDHPSAGPDAELAGLVGDASGARSSAERYPPPSLTGRRPTVSSTRSGDRDRSAAPVERVPVQHEGPSWERARRSEAYPTIKSRSGMPGMPGLPRVAVLAGALGIAAVALFFLPALLGIGGSDDPSPTPSPSVAVATPTPEPTPVPAPTPQVYVIKEGDTLSRVADDFSVSLEEILEANPEIENPNQISVGQEIVIPVAVPDEVGGESEEPAAS